MPENTITSLRINQLGLEAVKAIGTLTLAVQPTAGDTFVIGEETYTFVASGANEQGEINVGADLAAAKANLIAAINGSDGWNAPNPYASAGTFTGDNLPITARIPGPFGNTIVFTENFTSGSNVMNGGGFLGGTTAGAMARGTPVAATMRLAVEQLEWGDDDEQVYNPNVANGIIVRHTGPGTPTQHGTRFSLPDQAAFWEMLPLWFAMTVDGNPTLTGSAGGPYVWTFVGDPTTNPNPFSATLQRRLTNGLGDNIDERAAYAMLERIGLSFNVNGEIRLAGVTGFARKFTSNAITGGLTMPDFETMVSALSTVYFDALWANVGTTLLAEQVIGWRWDLLTGVFPRHTAEGRTTLDLTKHQLNGRNRGIDMEIQCLLDPDTYAAELARAADPATNQFAVRLKVTGSSGRELLIDQLMQHDKPLWQPGEDDGQDVITFRLRDASDGTNFLRIQLTLPDTYTIA